MTEAVEAPAPGEMSLVEHLAELRTRLTRAVLALLLGAIVGYVLFPQLLAILIEPYCGLPQAYRLTTGECALVALKPLEAFSVRVKTALVFGAFVGAPVITYQVWRFVTPGLMPKERRYALPFVVMSQVMFALGIATAYLIIPQGLRILVELGGPQIAFILSAGEYLSFVLTTSMAFGLVFETPLLLIFLALVGVVSASGLRRFRPYAIVLSVVVGALITPTTDAVTLLFLAAPMIVFYEVAIVAAWFIERSRARRP